MAVHRLTKPEQHCAKSFALHRTFIRKKKKSVTGKRWYFLMWERREREDIRLVGFSKASGEMGTSRAWGGRLPCVHLVHRSIRNPVGQFAVKHFSTVSVSLSVAAEGVNRACCLLLQGFNKHTLPWYPGGLQTCTPFTEMRNGEEGKICCLLNLWP